ncbi:hypothetical protein HUB98_05935 [Paenibacillus barcinonensis]|uniref:Uncharacterized protein n=1 Tax=Paenibacillus barcinonensis TaxID=198119 RepID=A0A2V4W099_PAEBA|nr:hypothetical protein [Paenibacillus barcinonensis]PYE51545.1 hypothetical protein DFQ00_102339 [Paenibacillus barcinonensis]QKS55921.1 hypothetical protein HUB98_05935 [Paenibacillus barcinonensis]
MLDSLNDIDLQSLISYLSPVLILITSGILLLLANKHERILFTPKRNLYRVITKILILSMVGTVLATVLVLFATTLVNDDTFKVTLTYLLIVFIVYFVVMALVNGWVEKNVKVYHWVYLEKYDCKPLLIHKVTFNNKLMLSSAPSPQDKLDQGLIIIEDVSILDNQEIHFIGPKKRNFILTNRPKTEDLLQAIDNCRP